MELVVYSQDDIYSQSLRDAKEKLGEDAETKEMVNCSSEGFSTDNHATLHEMKLHLETYYTVIVLTKAFCAVRGCSICNVYDALIYHRLQASV